MKRWNVLAASLIVAMFVSLSLLPLTRDALRFDMQLAAGKPILGSTLTDLGLKQSDMPLGGIGPMLSATSDQLQASSPKFFVQLANAMQLKSEKKWIALQRLAVEFPHSPVAQAALARIACKNGGSVGVGHEVEQAELSAEEWHPSKSAYRNEGKPEDARIMLRACEAGAQLEPGNAYFTAMAAIAHYARHDDAKALAMLKLAAQKPYWQEYIEVEAAGRVERARLLHGPQNSLTQSATYAGILFPQYAALRSLARVATAQALHLEQAGDRKAGLALRRDIARLGVHLRTGGTSAIANLVGVAIVQVAQSRPGGAPAYKSSDATARARVQREFLTYATQVGGSVEAVWWQRQQQASVEVKEIVRQAELVSAFGAPMLFQTQGRLLAQLVLLAVVVLLCTLGGLAFLRPWLERRIAHLAPVLAVFVFLCVFAGIVWQTLGNVRDMLAFSGLIQGLADVADGEGSNPVLASSVWDGLRVQLMLEGMLAGGALLTPVVYLILVLVRASRRRLSYSALLRQYTLPLAALLTLVYAAHLTAFSWGECTAQAELQLMLKHEGRYIAGKLGKPWP